MIHEKSLFLYKDGILFHQKCKLKSRHLVINAYFYCKNISYI